MNTIAVVGRLGRDPSSKDVNGKTVCAFSVAVDGRKDTEGKKDVLWLEVRAWGRLGENCQRYLMKGKQVSVVGELRIETWTGRDGNKRIEARVIADKVEFLGGEQTKSAVAAAAGSPKLQVPDDEIPF